MTLMFIQGHMVPGKLEHVQSFGLQLHGVTQIFVMVDYVKEVTVEKSCKYGEYGSFGHLLCLFFFIAFQA